MDANANEDWINSRERRRRSSATSILSKSLVSSDFMTVKSIPDLMSLDNENEKVTFKQALPEIYASLAATSFHLALGVCLAYTATLIPQLLDPASDIPTTKSQSAWIASVFVLVVPLGSFLAGLSMENIGRINTVKISTIPAVISCVMIALANNVYIIIAGRLIMGFATAFGTNPATVYITEITSPSYRGAMVSSGPTISSLGMMLGYLTGAMLPWRIVSWINVSYCLVPLILTSLFVPESPVWLVAKGRFDEARTSLQWFAKLDNSPTKEKKIERKLRVLMQDKEEKEKRNKELGQKTSISKLWSGFKKPTGYKPLIVLILFFFFQQYTGCYITLFYAVQFFEEAGSSMDPYHASIMIGATRFVMSTVTTVLLSRCGRRTLCIVSSIGMTVFMLISGYYTRGFITNGEASIVPVVCILLYVCFCMIGLLSLPWTMAAELFPTEIRGYGHAIVISVAHVFMFASVQLYYEMVKLLGGHDGLQWFFAGMSLLSLIFTYFLLPETFNKTLFEIENYFKNNFIYTRRKKEALLPTIAEEPRHRPIVRTRLESVKEERSESNGLDLSGSIPFIDASVTNLNKQ